MEEFELTYLVKYLPENLDDFASKEILDIYIPFSSPHPKIRLRKSGMNFEITKKEPINGSDSSYQLEQTIKLTEDEFVELAKIPGKQVRKIRYYYKYNNRIAEFDVFQDSLRGLVVVDFEFSSHDEKDNFAAPDFCLADVTQEEFIAGGMLCGKSYENIKEELSKFNYKKL